MRISKSKLSITKEAMTLNDPVVFFIPELMAPTHVKEMPENITLVTSRSVKDWTLSKHIMERAQVCIKKDENVYKIYHELAKTVIRSNCSSNIFRRYIFLNILIL